MAGLRMDHSLGPLSCLYLMLQVKYLSELEQIKWSKKYRPLNKFFVFIIGMVIYKFNSLWSRFNIKLSTLSIEAFATPHR